MFLEGFRGGIGLQHIIQWRRQWSWWWMKETSLQHYLKHQQLINNQGKNHTHSQFRHLMTWL